MCCFAKTRVKMDSSTRALSACFSSWEDADAVRESSVAEARKVGDRVCGDPGTEPDWEVSWTIESHPLL